MDLELLAKSLGRSVDDTILCIHMVLAYMTAHVSDRKLPIIAKKKLLPVTFFCLFVFFAVFVDHGIMAHNP